MKYVLSWNEEKNQELIVRYGFGFERILVALQEGKLLDDRFHPNVARYGHQRQIVVEIERFAYVVPYVTHEKEIFLKTFFPSRKTTKQQNNIYHMNNKKITKAEEQALVRLTESAEKWVPVGPLTERKEFWSAVASRAIEGKPRRISIAVNEDDLARLRSEAVRTGIPYQTIINSLIRNHVR